MGWFPQVRAADVAVQVGPGTTFSPRDVTINVNDRVVWTWVNSVHTTTSSGNPPLWDSGFRSTGTFERVFTTVGTFNYYCAVVNHAGYGQRGSVTVLAGNTPPTVTITNPVNDAVFIAPATFTIDASASDPDGSVTNVQFFRDATSLGNDTSSPYSVSVNGLAAGNYTLSAVASDNHGSLATNSIVVTVVAPGFVQIPIPGLRGVDGGRVAWGDYDNDGRLDFLFTGYIGYGSGGNPYVSQLWRNTGSGFSNVTASVAPGLLAGGFVAWGDYDNDGRLDFLITGVSKISQLWRNTGAGFSNVTASVAPGLPGGTGSSAAWGDYDNDGRLDFLLTGYFGSPASQLWRNTGSGFSNVTASVAPVLPGVYNGVTAWGDYDNDGRLDFLITGGVDGLSGTSQLWRNTGGGFSNVTASVASGLPGSVSGGSAAWGDFDNDGRLDFLLTASGISQLWRNNMPVASNAPPAAPTRLSSTLSGATVSLSWNPPADDRTPITGLNYNLRIGTTPGGSDVLAPMALTDGLRLLPALGNAQAGTDAVLNLPFGRYYWSVQAVDTTFAGSPFAAEQQFTIGAPRITEPLILGNGHFQFSFSNEASVIYAVLGTTNVSLPVAQWTVLGSPVSLGGGLYRFTDTGTMGRMQRFYILRVQ